MAETEDGCEIAVDDRNGCGSQDVTPEDCSQAGCCYRQDNQTGPVCFYKAFTPCSVPLGERYDCGHKMIDKPTCEGKGCCWEERPNPYPWCYYRKTSGAFTIFTDGKAYDRYWHITNRKSFSFTVTACKEVHIYVSAFIYSTTAENYEVILGDGNPMQATIKKWDLGNITMSKSVTHNSTLTSCNESKAFYISWMNGLLQVGPNSDDIILEFYDSESLPVTMIGIATVDQPGRWVISEHEAVSVFINTPNEESLRYQYAWFSLSSAMTSIIFRVKASSNVHVLLAENLEIQDADAYEIILGDNGNTQSSINLIGSEEKVTLQTPGILDGSESQFFWVSWKDGHVEVGQGMKKGEKRFIDHVYVAPPNARFFSMKTPIQHPSTRASSWEFLSISDDTYTVPTSTLEDSPPDYSKVTIGTTKKELRFNLIACSFAYLLLSSSKGDKQYQITLGELGVFNFTDSSSIVTLESDGGHKTLARVSTPGLLGCDEMRSFWLSWSSDRIKLGRGTVLDNSVIMTSGFHFPQTNYVNTISIATTDDMATAYWMFPRNDVDRLIIKTGNTYSYENLLYNTFEKKSIVFKVSACSGATIALSQYPGVLLLATYEVILGAENNTKSLIRDTFSGTILAEVPGSPLRCPGRQTFWISWGKEALAVGTGSRVGQKSFLTAISTTHPIHAMAVATTQENSGDAYWEFTESLGEAYTFMTRPSTAMGDVTFLTYVRSFAFNAYICSGMRVFLLNNPGENATDHYEIEIGVNNNTRSSIYKNGLKVVTARTDGVLNCQEFQGYWLTWYSDYDTIKFGKGDPNSEPIIEFKDDRLFRVNAVSVSSDSIGQWVVSPDQAISTAVTTSDPDAIESFEYDLDDQDHVILKVQCCKDVSIALMSYRLQAERLGYEIMLGVEENTKSIIVDTRPNGQRVSVETKGIVSCNQSRHFWISWSDGQIEVGKGMHLGYERFLHLEDPNPIVITSLSVSTTVNKNNPGRWEFSKFEDNYYGYYTSGSNSNEDLDVIMTGYNYFNFGVKTCEEAKVILYQDKDRTKAYTIVIGASQSHTYIQRGDSQSIPSDQITESPEVLDCFVTTMFTIRWTDGSITVTNDHSFYFAWTDPEPLPIYSLSFASFMGANWVFPRRQGDTVEYMSARLSPAYFLMSFQGKDFLTFQLKVCDQAYILLSEHYGIQPYSTYEIALGENQGVLSSISENPGSNDLCDQIDDDKIVSCQQYNSFWISWKDNILKFGRGEIPGEQILLTCRPKTPHPVTAVTVHSESFQNGYWAFTDDEVRAYRFFTENDFPYWQFNKVWVLPRNTYLSFDIQAPEWAVICVASIYGNCTTKAHEIHLAKTDRIGQNSFILDKDTGKQVVTFGRQGILHNGRMTSFWIAWENSLIVGYGRGPGMGAVFMQTPYELPYDVNAVSFATPTSNSKWEIPKELAPSISFTAAGNEFPTSRLQVVTKDMQHLVFLVQACSEVAIVLSTDTGAIYKDSDVILLGGKGNTVSGIMDTSTDQPSYSKLTQTKDLLHCDQKRAFWVGWDNGTIDVGQGGDRGIGGFLSWDGGKVRNVGTVSLFTRENNKGIIDILNGRGNTFNINTRTSLDYEVSWIKLEKNEPFFRFRVRGCNDAHILLTSTMGKTDNMSAYEIVIGGFSNQRVFIRRGALTPSKVVAEVPEVLDCSEFRSFWIMKKEGRIEVGSGNPGEHRLAHWADPKPIDVNYASVSTGWESSGEWEIQQWTVDGIRVNTPYGDFPYKNVWVAVMGYDFVSWKIEACSEAKIALASTIGKTSFETYEVVFGVDGQQGVGIRKEVGGDFVAKGAAGKTIVDCNTANTYWISWASGEVRVGEGSEPYDMPLVSFTTGKKWIAVNSMSVATDIGIKGKWELVKKGVIPPSSENMSGLGSGAIVGIVVGVVLALALIGGAVVFIIPKSRNATLEKLQNIQVFKKRDDQEPFAYGPSEGGTEY